jgi:hypothetical protein
MRIKELLAENNIIQFPGRESSSMKTEPTKTSLLQAFGSEEMNALSALGKGMVEKPSYWEDLDDDNKTIDAVAVKRLEKTLKKTLPVYTGIDVYGHTRKPKNPQAVVQMMPPEKMFIVDFDGERYLVDRTGAKSYIRFWLRML